MMGKQSSTDKTFSVLLFASAMVVPLLLGAIAYILLQGSNDAIHTFGLIDFVTSSDWIVSADAERYGAFAFVIGTLYTTTLALLLCIPLALSIAVFCGEYYPQSWLSKALSTVTNLLAGIPSIIYGLWGFYALRPWIIKLGLSEIGSGIFTASAVLAIMIVPYAASLSTEFIKMVPNELKENAYSLGATRAEVIRKIIFPTAGAGIFSSFILAVGRAIGETMTVTMLIGNTNNVPYMLFDTGNSMASIIANQFGEADGLRLSSLFTVGLVLFLITAIINLIGKILIKNARI